MDLITTLVKGYDLSGGAANWTSADLSDFTNYYLDFIWSNVTGTLDGEFLIRETSDEIVFNSIETFAIDTADETRLKNNIGLSKDKINVKFTPNGITGGRLTIKLRALESNLQEHKAESSIHFTEESIDHTNIQNIGTNTHAEIDTHLALTNEHIDWTDTSENFGTTGDAGIGIVTPTTKCQVSAVGASKPAFSISTLLSVVRSAGSCEIAITSNAASKAQLFFGDTNGAQRGAVIYDNNIEELSFQTNAATRVKITSTGNVEILKDLLFVGSGSGLPCGEIYVNDNTTVTSVSNAGFTQFLYFDTNGHANLTTPDHTNDHILIDKAGVYVIDCCVNIKNSSGAAHDIEVVIAKNNGATIFPNMRRHRTLGTGTDVGAIPICGHLGLAINDTIEVWITSDSGAARDVTAEDVVLMLTMVGGN